MTIPDQPTSDPNAAYPEQMPTSPPYADDRAPSAAEAHEADQTAHDAQEGAVDSYTAAEDNAERQEAERVRDEVLAASGLPPEGPDAAVRRNPDGSPV